MSWKYRDRKGVGAAPAEKNDDPAEGSEGREEIEGDDVAKPPRGRVCKILKWIGSAARPNRDKAAEDQVRFARRMLRDVLDRFLFFLLHVGDFADFDVVRPFCRVVNRMQIPSKHVLGLFVIAQP